jgi:hypothetical protein
MNWTPIRELVGQDINGKRAIVSQPKHFPMFERFNERPKERTLLCAEYKQERDHRGRNWTWLYVRWIPESGDFSCGYSGWREDYDGTPVISFVDGAV